MTFGPHHYVPVLKVKRGEKAALRSVVPGHRHRITPLLEIVARKPDKANVAKHLDTAFRDLAASATLFPRVFLDLREIADDGPAAANDAFHRAVTEGIPFTPVTGLDRTADLAAALSHRARGLVLRVTRGEFEGGVLATRITAFMARHGLASPEVDLVVDLGAVDDLVSAGVMGLTRAFLAEIPDHARWRTLTVVKRHPELTPSRHEN